MSDILRALLEKEEKLKNKIHFEKSRISKAKRSADTRTKIILGGLLLSSAKSDDGSRQVLLRLLSFVTRQSDIEAINLSAVEQNIAGLPTGRDEGPAKTVTDFDSSPSPISM